LSNSLIEQTDAWLTRKRFSAPRQKTFYPSEASVVIKEDDGTERVVGTCMRAAYLRVTGEAVGKPNEARSEYIMSMGKTIEQWLVEQWKEMGILVANNAKFYWEEYNVSGELDSVLIDPSTGDQYGVEVKSYWGYDARKEIMGNRSHGGFPKLNQLLQTLIYTHFFREKLKYFKMVYVARDDIARKEFDIEVIKDGDKHWPVVNGRIYRKFTIEDVLSRYKLLGYHVQNKIMPPRDYELVYDTARVERENAAGNVSKTAYAEWKKGKRKIGDWQCKFCSYRDYCWKDESNQVVTEDEETEVPQNKE